MNKKTISWIIFGVGMLTLGFLLYIDNYHLIEKDNKLKENDNTEVRVGITKSLDELEINSEPSFKIGQKYFYVHTPRVRSEGYYFETEMFEIKGTEKINETDYYVVICNYSSYVSKTPEADILNSKRIGGVIITWYYDKKNGKSIGKNINPENYTNEDTFTTDHPFFARWMLYLKENIGWHINDIVTQTVGDTIIKVNKRYEFKVVGKEKIDNVECFKVKLDIVDIPTKKIEKTRYYYVDVNRRIGIKMEEFEDGIRMYEVNLIE